MKKITSQIAKVFLLICIAVLSSAGFYETMAACTTAITTNPSNTSACAGGNASFAVVASNACAVTITYQWQVWNGSVWTTIVAAGSNPTYSNWTTATLTLTGVVIGNNNYQYQARATCSGGGGGCGSTITSVWSTSGTLTVNPVPTAVTVTAPGAGPFCGNVVLTATGGTGGTIYFQGTTTGGTSTASPGATQTVSVDGTYYFRARTGSGCWGTQGSVNVTILPSAAPPTLLIEAYSLSSVLLGNNPTICQQQTIQFYVDWVLFNEPDESKRFKWKKNGAVVDSTTVTTNAASVVYSTATLVTGDVITLTIKWLQPPSTTCFTPDSITSPPITFTVTPNQPPTASISVSPLPGDTICRGSQLTFTANSVDAGSPTYQWYLDGILQAGETAITYVNSATIPSGSHNVYCRVISNQACDVLDPVYGQTVFTSPWIFQVNPCYYFVPASGSTGPFYTCGSPFYDSALDWPVNYSNNVNGTVTFCPGTVGQYSTISFTSMVLNDAGDRLRIWAGTDTSTYSTPLATFTGNYPSLSGCSNVITAPAVSNGGCLTAKFYSDASGTAAGWVAGMSCSTTPAAAQVPGATCANATLISALPYTVSGHTTQCYVNDYGTTPCGTYNGDDHVYVYTATGPECTSITLSGATGSPILSVYLGCPDAATGCVSTQTGNSVAQVTFPGAGTYYIVVDEAAAGFSNYNLDIQTFGIAPANDLPCNAQYIDLLVNVNGNNYCTGGASEPASASCWTTGGSLNTLWYSFTSPASPNPSAVKIRTTPGSISTTQIALYSLAGSCSNPANFTERDCNLSGPTCASGGGFTSSEIIYSNLTPSTIYYIRVDGRNSNTGDFSIVVADVNNAQQPYVDGQDCVVPMTVCASSFSVGNPGFLWTGWVCDYSGNNTCMAAGERSSAWYVFTTNGNGTLNFALTPNGSTDYDWVLMDITTFGSDQATRVAGACPQINSGNLPWVRCNWSGPQASSCGGTYVTGMCAAYSNTTAGGGGPNFSSNLAVGNNQTFMLNVSNYTQNATGFTINFNNESASPINYQNPPTNIYWSGGANTTDWFTVGNWGNCGPPSCNTNAVITTAASVMPVIPTGQTAYCKNLDIKSGASVTMNGTATLNICGNFVNNGGLIAATTATVNLQGNLVQYFDGNMIGSSSFPIFSMSKGLNNMTILDNARVKTSLVLPSSGWGGKIITGPKELYITSGVSGASTFGDPTSYVEGNLRRNLSGAAGGPYYFPVGDATKGWQLATITFNSAHSIQNILGFFNSWAGPAATGIADGGSCIVTYNTTPGFYDNGYWTLTASPNTSVNYDLRLRNGSVTNGPGLAWTIVKSPSIVAPSWSLSGACTDNITAAYPFSMRTGMSGFSVFATVQSSNPLPITLLNFDAVPHGTGVMTTWVTAAEVNNDYFIIERSADGVHFDEVGTRKGAGNSTATLYYSMLDLKPHKGVSYYRLRQFDFDGANTKSELVAVSFLSDNVLTVFPNPANTGVINMSFISAGAGDVKLEIIDMLGKVLLSQMLKVTKGQNDIRDYNISALPQGVYFVQLKPTGSEIIEPMQTRLVKQIREE